MRLFNKVAIIGVGLIGGSIGLATKKRGVASYVTGVFRRPSTMKRALRRKAVDRATMNLRKGVRDADLIILAAPVRAIPSLAAKALRYAKRGAIVTDAGSTKGWIVENVEKTARRFPGVYFVGSHPMAGSERAGVEFARHSLLNGAPCIVTKTVRTDGKALRKVVRFWEALGSKVRVMSPAHHDRTVAMISHLPHVMAFSIAGAVPAGDISCAAEGFWDTTRVASSDPELWADIFFTNKKEIARSCKSFGRYYSRVLKALKKDRYREVVRLLRLAKRKRDREKVKD